MARNIDYTLVLTGQLVAQTPLHTGGADSGHLSDMPLAMDGQGCFYIPGTSIAGAIRAWQQAEEKDAIWGYAGHKEESGHASYYIVDDAPVCVEADAAAPMAELWHGIGIDRRYGGTAHGVLFDRQVLPQGTRFEFRLQREIAADHALEEARQQMGQLLEALQQGGIPFGGGVTRGFGRLRLEQSSGKEIHWSSKAGVLAWLQDDGKGDGATAENWANAAAAVPAGLIEICIHWRPQGPLMSKAAQDGLAVDMLPFTSRTKEGRQALTLPGSAIKGALRQHAERIVRTVLDLDGVDDKPHHEQVDVPLASRLFGAARPPDSKDKGQGTGQKPMPKHAARSLLYVDTCYTKPESALDDRQFTALQTTGNLLRDNQPLFYKADHVAIDRWTGGASDGALYNAVEPNKSIEWQPIHLRLDCRRGGGKTEFALLWLVLRDFCAGRIPLGFGANRGYGDLEVKQIALRGLSAVGMEKDELTLPVAQRCLDELAASELVNALTKAWSQWLQAKPEEQAARAETAGEKA